MDVSEQAWDALVGSIYDVPSDPAGFAPVFDRLTHCLGACQAGLVIRAADGEATVPGASTGVLLADTSAYVTHYAAIDPIMPILSRTRPGQALADHQLVDRATYERGEFYNDWALPSGHGHGLMLALSSAGWAPGGGAMVLATRPAGAQPFGPAERALMQRAAPHLARALLLWRRLAAAEAPGAAATLALDRIAAPVLLADAAARLAWANRAGEHLLARGGALSVGRAGLLRGAAPAATTALHRLIAAVAARGEGDALRLGGRMSEEALSLLAVPLSGAAQPIGAPPGLPRPLVMLMVPDAARAGSSGRSMEARLRRLHGLTPAEAGVAVLLARGEGLPAVGEALGIGHSTARTHLARIFAKTSTSRQAELARLVEALSVLEGG
jgi:DNA-binding CsgD family transcriptional regulator